MPRAIWSGTISFGLVSVPVKLYAAVKQKDTRFHQLDKRSGARIRYKRVSEETGREVPYEQIAKGYEISRDQYVMIDPEELEELDPEPTQRVDIEDFVALAEIDPIYYEHPYYLAPDRGGAKSYKLLLKTLADTKTVGIGKMVMRSRQYLAAIRPKGKLLCLSTMLFHDEVVDDDTIEGLPDASARVTEKEAEMATRLISQMRTEFDATKYQDDYRERVRRLIKKKSEGEVITPPEGPERAPAVVDLMEALRQSVAETGGAGRRRHATRGRAKAKNAKTKKEAGRRSA